MKLVIGGAYQGKLDYAQKTYHIEEGWIDGRTCSGEDLLHCSGIHHFHSYIRRMIDGEVTSPLLKDLAEDGTPAALEQQSETFAERLSTVSPGVIIVCSELGCGIVPVDRADRTWREATGRICTALARRSDEVVRVVCGIGQRIR